MSEEHKQQRLNKKKGRSRGNDRKQQAFSKEKVKKKRKASGGNIPD